MKSKRLSAIIVMMMTVIIMLGAFCLPASAATSLSKATVTYETSYTYTGKAIKPTVTVKVGSKKLTKNKSYTVSYKNNKSVGKATITITGKGSYTGKISKSFYIVPKATSTLKATGYSTKIKLSWSKVTGAYAYQVYQKAGSKWVKLDNTKNTSYTVTGLDSVTDYTFRVRAYTKTSSKTLYSSFKNITKSTTIGKPTEMTASDVTQNSATLKWNAIPGATSYRVTLTNNSNGYSETFTTTSPSLKLTSLYGSTPYSVKISALNTAKKITGNASDAFTFNTPAAPVKNLKAEAKSSTSVNLTWDKLSGIDAYQVFYSKHDANGNPTTYVKHGNITTNSCLVTGLSPCSYYTFRVRAYERTSSGTVYTEYTVAENIFTPVEKISSFKTTGISTDEISLSWTRPSNIDGYKLYKNGELIDTLVPANTTYKLTGLTSGTTYTLAINAYYKTFEGEKTELTVTTGSGDVESIAFTKKPTSSLKPGETFQLEVSVNPSYAVNKKVVYTSRDKDIASVSSSGVITALKDGKTLITAASESNPNKSVSFTLTVQSRPTLAEAISLKSSYEILEGDLFSLNPTFTPADVSDKRYTVTGSNYSYIYNDKTTSYKNKTDTCYFEDYITVTSTGMIKGIKPTVEPKTGNAFSFVITVRTADGSNKTATTRIKVLPRMIELTYNGAEEYPWYYGNSAKLSATLDSSIASSYSSSDIRFKSSNTSIATVTNDGTVTCKGAGDVTITAYTSDNKYSGSYEIYSKSIVSVDKSFYDLCQVGKTYQINAKILPAGNGDYITYYSSNPSVATVDTGGRVTFLKQGYVQIRVSNPSDASNYKQVWFTTAKVSTPSGTPAQLLKEMKTTANAVKSLSNLPSLTRHDITNTDNFVVNSKSSFKLTADDLKEMFSSSFAPKYLYLGSVASTNGNFTTLKEKFISNVPVQGQAYIIAPTLADSDVKEIKVTDNGDYFYEMKLTLKDENLSTLPTVAGATRHGKVFDVLTSGYINDTLGKINNSGQKISINYSAFTQRYHNSTLTLKVNKVTGNIEKATFDMNIDINITQLVMKYSLTGIGLIDPTYTMDVSFTCNNIVNLDFSGYAN